MTCQPSRFFLFAAAVGLVFCSATRMDATIYVRVADQDLAARADVIAEGVVLEIDDSAVTSPPSTTVRVEIAEVIRGFAPGSVVSVAVPGGRDASGMELRIHGAPVLIPGERVLLFLRAGADQTHRVLHLSQGVFHVAEAGGRAVAFREFGDAVEVEWPGREALAAERPRDLERFKAWIGSGAKSMADYFVDVDRRTLAGWQAKFTLFENSGLNLRWPDFDGGGNVRWLAHEAGQAGIADGGFGDFQAALEAWNGDAGSLIRLSYGGTTSNSTGLTSFDGVNTIVFDNLDGAGTFDAPFNCARGGVVAQAGPWFSTSSQNVHTFNGQRFFTILSADIVTNDGVECWIGTQRRAEEVFAHELGHTLGFGHSCGDDPSGPCDTQTKREALMRAQAHGDNRGADLRADDRAAAAFLYEDPNAPSPPAAPSGLGTSFNAAGQVRLSWTDNADNETGFRIERRIGGGSFAEVATVSADATSWVDASSLPPATTVTYRVRAFNDDGDSGASNSASVTTPAAEPTVCEPSDRVLCLNGERFQVEVDWRNSAGQRGAGRVVELGVTSDDSGLFWFFEADNWELLVKVLNGCAVNNHFWVFAAATTDVEFTLRVTDTKNGRVSTYRNRLGEAAPAITDTGAFETCP